jgi:pimeloyl-ACP methyl ester carboxylesterase
VRPPLVLLPGMNCTDDLWADVTVPGSIRWPLAERSVARQVAALLDGLPERFVIAGLSLGGVIAMETALVAPERVAGLCVMSVNGRATTAAQRQGWRAWRERLAAGETPAGLQREILPSLLPAAVRRRDLIDRVLGMGEQTTADQLDAQLAQQLSRRPLLDRLAALDLPTLVVSGTADPICPPVFHAEIAAAVDGARLVPVDAGHLPPLERPDVVRALLDTWLAEVAGGQRQR